MEPSIETHSDPEEATQYVYTDHGSSLQKACYSAWIEKDYCDITLRVGKDSIQTHRLVLTSLSEYFRNLLKMDVNGIKDEAELHEVDFDSLCQILTFGYTGKIEISMENVAALFIASCYLQVVFVKESCEKFLLDNMDQSNCVRTWCLADQYSSVAVVKKAVQMLMMEFENISRTEDFVTMITLKMLLGVLEQEGQVVSRDGIILPPVQQEVVLLEGVLHYIDSTNCSGENAVSLLKAIRLPLIERAIITEYMSKYPKLCQDNDVNNLMDVLKTGEESTELLQQTNRNWLSPRRPKISGYLYDPKMYGLGGRDGVHFFLRNHYGLPRPSKEAIVTSVDVHLRFWSPHSQQDPIIGGLTFKYSDDTVLQGGMAADSPYCTKVESFTLQDSEYISKVVFKSGWVIDSIMFETNFGKAYGPWGGPGGGERICVAPNCAVGYLHSFAGLSINSGGAPAVYSVRLGWATLGDTEQELDTRQLYGTMKPRHSKPSSEEEEEDELGFFNTDSDEYENSSDDEQI